MDYGDIPGSEGEVTASQFRVNMHDGGASCEIAIRGIDKSVWPRHGAQHRAQCMRTTEIVSDEKAGHAAHFG